VAGFARRAATLRLRSARGAAAAVKIDGRAKTVVPASQSGGLVAVVIDLTKWWTRANGFIAQGFKAMKMRLGSTDPKADIARVKAVRPMHRSHIKIDG